jgi:hypothetical protein
MSKANKEMTTNYTDVDVSHLNFTDLEENTRSKGQRISYIRYTNPDSGSEIPFLKVLRIPSLKGFSSSDSYSSLSTCAGAKLLVFRLSPQR